MFEWMSNGQYSNGTGFNGGYVTRDAFGSTYDTNGQRVFGCW